MMDTSCSTLAFTSSGYDDTVTLHAEQHEVLSYKLLFVQRSFACLLVDLFTQLFTLVHTTIHMFALSLTHSLICSFTKSCIRSFTHWVIQLFKTQLLTHSVMHLFIHSLVHSFGQDTLVLTLTID